jgi:hypothetical protein
MNSIIFQNILFLALSAFLIFLIAGIVIFTIYSVKIFKKINKLFNLVNGEVEKITSDIDATRNKIKEEGDKIKYFATYLLSFFKKHPKKSKKTDNN